MYDVLTLFSGDHAMATPKKVPISTTVPLKILQEIKGCADAQGLNENETIRLLVLEGLAVQAAKVSTRSQAWATPSGEAQ